MLNYVWSITTEICDQIRKLKTNVVFKVQGQNNEPEEKTNLTQDEIQKFIIYP